MRTGNKLFAEAYLQYWNHSFQLERLILSGDGYCRAFSKFLYYQHNLEFIDLSHIQMRKRFPYWLLHNNTKLEILFIINNSLRGPFRLPFQSHMNLSWLDISYNSFTGSILIETGTHLRRLRYPMMSKNGFSDSTPYLFGNMSSLEILDLSHNNFTGSIPSSLLKCNQLKIMDVSYNHLYAHKDLSGKTPERVAQFATFDQSSYEGNPFLCGLPLPKSCNNTSPSPPVTPTEEKEDNGFMDMGVFCVSFVVSYIMVLLAIAAVLYINPYWRRRWFYFIETSLTNCYYFLVDNIPLLSKFGLS
ncbi:receptor-like protein 1 [Manihot esculenta]|uniref:receptor-like protein 1 n=1 Tax=Manihot esculenta TaxID=3983 RepID=UPI001CC7C396|nr:receptor-like protein 1 [Manihot esculenta]